jgi:Recombination endonuclease VII
VSEFSNNKRSRDGLAFYCRQHLAERAARSREARRVQPRKHRFAPPGLTVPDGHKWCPDCGSVKSLELFPRTTASRSGRATYCLPCHNLRGRASREKVGGSRTYHLTRRYGITAEEADEMLAEQGGLCAICQTEPAAHVDHDHDTGRVRELLCFNCNGGLGQFKDEPELLRAAADYVELHRASPRPVSSRPGAEEGSGVGPGRRRSGVPRDRRCSPGFARWKAMTMGD